MTNLSRLSILKPYLWRHKWGYLIGLSSLLVTDILLLVRPKLVGRMIDTLGKVDSGRDVTRLVLLFLAIVVVENGFRVAWRKTLVSASRRVERDLMVDFFRKLITLDAQYYDRTPTGDLMARATNDIASIRMLLGPGIMGAFDAVVVFTVALFFMLSVSPRLTAYALFPVPFGTIVVLYLMRNVHRLYDAVQAQFSTISARAQETISGIRVIKAHNRQEYETEEFEKVTAQYIDKYVSLSKFDVGFEPVIRFVAGFGVMIVLFVGGGGVIRGQLTLGGLTEFFLYLDQIIWPMIAIGWSGSIFERSMASLIRIEAVFNETPVIVPVSDSDDHRGPFSPGDIEFKNVRFRFTPDGPEVLRGINLTVPRGSTLGILGPLGSGKSALIGLIPRLYDPVGGEIRIGGKNIKDISPKDLRGHVGFVQQEPFLFSRNISANIQMGRPADSKKQKETANVLDLAYMSGETRDFPDGLDTVLGERGVRLSGGQKQRMTIARALARDPDILILDDALSSVDTHAEEQILRNLREFMRGRTNIIVSHRISTIKNADRIIVLDEGQIIEQGTHQDLLAENGFYAKLHRQQQLREELERI